MDMNLKDKKVLVTGGTRGIGKAIVEAFVNEGAIVGFCARSEVDVHAIERKHNKVIRCVKGNILDITEFSKVRLWVEDFVSSYGGIDILISNVSAQSFHWEDSFKVDILSCANIIDIALPYIKNSESGGAIVAIASKAALLSVPSYKPYSAMKAALVSYISSLSRELAPFGVRVNSVSPGEIKFPGGFWERIKVEDPKLYNRTIHSLPGGRFGKPEEVANAVVFLASPRASFVSGTNLLVDGASREHVQF